MSKRKLTYEQAGVNIEKGEKFAQWIGQKATSTFSSRVLSKIGASAGLYALNKESWREPILVATADGVGTKLKIAQSADQHNTVGIDLVAMCVNDLLTSGARPLFFLDYLATGKLSLDTGKEIISGIMEGCRRAECTLLGGETAEMPSFYEKGKYDLAGFAVGIVEKEKMIDSSKIKPGDKILGLSSSGLHSNGFSLVRKVLFEEKNYSLTRRIEELGRSLKEELLEPTRIYTRPVLSLLKNFKIKGIAHITGGGMVRNIPRILPPGCKAQIYKGKWKIHPIFHLIQKEGNIDEDEMFKVFNMGIGMVLIIPPEEKNPILEALADYKEEVSIIGEITTGEKGVEIVK